MKWKWASDSIMGKGSDLFKFRNHGMILLSCISLFSGCAGLPKFSPESKNEIVYSPWTGFRATNSVDTDMAVEDLKFERDQATGKVIGLTAKKITFTSQQGKTDAIRAQLMDRYDNMIQHAWAGLNTQNQIYWSGANQLAGTAAGVLGPYLQGRNVVQGLKVMRPNMLEEAAVGVAMGKVDLKSLIPQLEPADIEAIVGRVKEIASKASTVSTQPSGG